jgi:hypothetical protein
VAATRCKTSKAAIAEYWLDTEEGRCALPANAAMIDWGEPSCFACGWMATDPDEEPILWRVWNRAQLQRCHLIPHALGGDDSPPNLVLLCSRCHSEAPDVGNPEYMLRWIGAHESWGTHLHRETQTALRLAGVTDAMIVEFNERFLSEGLDALGSAMSDWAVPVAGRFSYSTLAACAVEAVRRVVSVAASETPSSSKSERGFR